LDDTTVQSLSSISIDGMTLTFTANTAQLQALAVNDVIAMGVSRVTPRGLLRKVTGVRVSGNQVVVSTARATLVDALKTASIHVKKTLVQRSASQTRILKKGVSIRKMDSGDSSDQTKDVQKGAKSLSFGFNFDNTVLYDDGSGNNQVVVNGSVNFDLGFDFNVDIGIHYVVVPYLQSLSFSATATDNSTVGITAKGSYPLEEKQQVAEMFFNPIVIMVGPIPVVITPKVVVYVGLDGALSAGMTAEATQAATFTAGIAYDSDTGWNPISNLDKSASFQPPTRNGSVNVRAYAGPEVDVLIYDLVGPYADIYGYLKLDADINQNPWWKLYGGVKADAGVKMDLFVVNINEGFEIFDVPYLLAQASSNNGANGAYVPLPAAPTNLKTASVASKVTLTWDKTTNASHYKVYRDGVEVTTWSTRPNTETFVDTPPSPGTTYSYYVTAVNETGESGPSNTVSIKDSCLSTEPTNVTAATANGMVILKWDEPTSVPNHSLTKYDVYRSTMNPSFCVLLCWDLVGYYDPNLVLMGYGNTYKNPTYTDSDASLKPGTTYWYGVTAVNSCGASKSSADVSIAVVSGMSRPTGLTVISYSWGGAMASLNWMEVPGADSYKVYRIDTYTGSGAVAFSTTTTTASYIDTGVGWEKGYNYYVTAVKNGVETKTSDYVYIFFTTPIK
jgi:fibronectin type 3 domain-containing protein